MADEILFSCEIAFLLDLPGDPGFAYRVMDGDLPLTEWIGPYEDEEAAKAAFMEDARAMISDLVKKTLGLSET